MELPQLRQSPVVFNEEDHTYLLGDRYLKGVTGTLVRRAYPHTYDTPEGMPEEVWKEKLRNAAANGTSIHQAIELYEDLGVESDMPEVQNYIAVKHDNGFINLATEYIVSDEKMYASAVDHVWYHEESGGIFLIDIKRTSEVHYPDVLASLHFSLFTFQFSFTKLLPYTAFLMAAFSALRLAKFNLDERQHYGFIGLPTPANALFWGSLVLGEHAFLVSQKFNAVFLLLFVVLFCMLLVSEVPMLALKFRNMSWSDNKQRYIFLLGCLPILALAPFSLHIIIIWYVAVSVVGSKFIK